MQYKAMWLKAKKNCKNVSLYFKIFFFFRIYVMASYSQAKN